jgi:hypothetical protein
LKGIESLFLSHEHSLRPGGGGQQQCSREYHESLLRAGFDLTDFTFKTDRSWAARLGRKLHRATYSALVPGPFLGKVGPAAAKLEAKFVFCNLYSFIPHGPYLRRQLPTGTRLVLLSHGLASVDEVHAGRIAGAAGKSSLAERSRDRRLGEMLRIEARGLPSFDHVFCLAAFEVEICRWLGARSVSWVPRTIDRNSLLPWRPVGDRLGCVGTFDHPPNLEGLQLFCAALEKAGAGTLRLRLVTRSHEIAAQFAARYEFVDNLGPLEESGSVEAEAATWSAFVHPIFCFAMGCSTKVATGLGWGLPLLTTRSGLRGYSWREGNIALADSAEQLAAQAIGALEPSRAELLRGEILRVVASAPSIEEVASQVRRDLGVD